MYSMLTFALAMAVMHGCVPPPPLTPRAPTPGVAHFSVTTFNVHLDRSDDPATVRAVAAGQADIVALQEVSGPWVPVLEKTYATTYPHRLYQLLGGSSGLAVLSRFPLVDEGMIEGDTHPAWRVIAETPMGPVQLLHVHMRPVVSRKEGYVEGYLSADAAHRREIRAFSATLTELPTLVLGDFNEDPDGPAIAILEERGFRNALPLYHPGQETWRMGSFANQSIEALDHILFDRSFVPLNAFVTYAGHSDHLPVTAHFEDAVPE